MSRYASRVWKSLGAACVIVGLLAGCGDDGEDAGGGEGDAAVVDVGGGCEVGVSGSTDAKPEVTLPDCDPPAELVIADVVEGSGAEAAAGDSVMVQYAGISWSTGEGFDASWDRGAEPFEVAPLGSAQVIQGWNDGLLGAQAGDRRLLVIPPDLGYGEQGAGEAIGPGETLVFVIDVVSLNGS